MPRGYRHLQVSFAGGEMSPEMFSRFDDTRARSGAARLLNMIPHPRGSAARRPGFQLVNEVKDSTRESRLLDFQFSRDQTLAVEMGRATVDSLDIGYFRFHTQGATLLHAQPRAYVTPSLPSSADLVNQGYDNGSPHPFTTGDPIVPTLFAGTLQATFTTGTTTVTASTPAPGLALTGDAVVFQLGVGGALPPELEVGRVYYVRSDTGAGADFTIAETRTGTPITFTTGHASTVYVGVLSNGGNDDIDPNTTYYAVETGDPDVFGVATTRANAVAGTSILLIAQGTLAYGDVRWHYDYRPGDTTVFGGQPHYCRRIPWGTPGSRYVYADDHADHPPPMTSWRAYWQRMAGAASTVTFTAGTTNTVSWTAHGLATNTPVTFTLGTGGALPSALTEGVVYYVRPTSDPNAFQLAADPASTEIITLGTTGSPPVNAFAGGYYEVPHDYAEDTLFEINYAQSNDVLTLVHRDKPVAELRRISATRWELANVVFSASVAAPSAVIVAAFLGEGLTPSAVTAVNPALITFPSNHTIGEGETVYIVDIGDIDDGFYVVQQVPAPDNMFLRTFVTGEDVPSTTTTIVSTSRVIATGYSADSDETYAVTALDDGGGESPVSETATVTNNLLNNGAYNTISWGAVVGATRYNVYKEINGLFGFIGETDAPTTSFVDDNIAPDLSITPPRQDRSLRDGAVVTFSYPSGVGTVHWVAHGLERGAPVTFSSNKALPSGLVQGVTYYVLNPMPDAFELSSDPDGLTQVVFLAPTPPEGRHGIISGQFPSTVVYHEGRRVFAGSWLRPQDFWMTRSGTESDLSYHIPVRDADRIAGRIAARQRSDILHAVPVGNLIFLTTAAEYRVSPIDGAALTPDNVTVRAPTHVGVSRTTPVLVNNVILFPAARGGHIREMGILDTVQDYVTNDVSLRASHLFDNKTVAQMVYHQAPNPIVWVVSSGGTLLGFSYIPEEQIAGWHEHTVAGLIESCTTVAEGLEDRLYVIANRGGTRYVERMGCQCIDAIEDVFFVDFGATYSGAATTTVYAPHLASQAVIYLADGIEGSGTVSAAGVLTLTAAASKVHVGLAYTGQLQTLPLGLQVDAALGSGRTKNINKVWLRISTSGAFQTGPALNALVSSPAPAAGQLLTQLEPVTIAGTWDEEGQVYVQQAGALPLIVAGLTLEVATGA